MSKLKYTKVKTINGKQVLERGLSSEHTFYKGAYYTYATFRTEAGRFYIPVDLKGYCVNDPHIWEFISSIPEIA